MRFAKVKEWLRYEKRTVFFILLIICTYLLFMAISSSFGSTRTIRNIFFSNASTIICSIQMTMIVMIGGIDLSVSATNAFSSIIGAMVMVSLAGENGMGLGAGIIGMLVMIAVSAIIGAVNGAVSVYFKLSPFIVTLATMSLLRGLALGITNSTRIVIRNDLFTYVGQKSLFGSQIPAVLLIIILLYLISSFMLNKTVFGRKLIAVGGNRDAARASGINEKHLTVLTYAIGGLFVGLAAIITVGRSTTAHPLAANNAEMEIITIVVLSGASLSGGQGSLRGTFLAALLLSIINAGLNMLPVSPYFQYIVKGVLILAAIMFDQLSALKSHSSAKSLNKADWQTNLASVEELIKNSKQQRISLRNIHKSFAGVKALDDVSLSVKCGTVHAVLGENGAGKSTLMKVLSGTYKKDAGTIHINDIPIEIKSPIIAKKLGISVIYQEFSLIPELSVMQNVFLGKEILRKNSFSVNKRKMHNLVAELFQKMGMSINPTRRTFDHTVGQLQVIEIAKALSSNAWVIVMDEPTSAISEADKNRLFELIRSLRSNNAAIVYISHRLSEILEIADEVTVLRDGKTVFNSPTPGLNEQTLIKHMVGRELDNIFYRDKHRGGDTILEVNNLYRKNMFEPISFKVQAGEVLGFSGLMGAGRTEIMRCLYGLDQADSGEILLNGRKIYITSPKVAINNGIGFVSEDRRREGIVPLMGVGNNISLSTLKSIQKNGIIDRKKEERLTQAYIEKLSVKTPSLAQSINKLSGGNQQKCCIAKCLANEPEIVILDEPTRGIDIGAKAEIHRLIDAMAKEGKAVVLISSELPEIIGACDRIIVLHEGVKMAEFDALGDTQITQELLMDYASGNKPAH